jgi:microcystin-dependent protein
MRMTPQYPPYLVGSLFAGLLMVGTQPLAAQGCGGVPTGAVIAYAGETIPQNWMAADGRPLRAADHPQLFLAIGAAHGAGYNDAGVKTADFNLPDLRGRFLRGLDLSQDGTKSGTDPEADARTSPRFSTGNSGNRVGSYQNDATRRPNTALLTNNTGAHEHLHNLETTASRAAHGRDEIANTVAFPFVGNRNTVTATAGSHEHTIDRGGDAETRPKNVAVHMLICAK